MPKKKFVKKNVKKTFKKKEATTSYGRGGVEAPLKEITLKVPYKKNQSLFPDRYKGTGHTSYDLNVTSSTAANTPFQHDYSVIWNTFSGANAGDIQRTVGTPTPLTYNQLVIPAGLDYLLGDPNRSALQVGANRPFSMYRVHGSMIKVTYIPVTTGNVAPTMLTVIPSIYPQSYYCGMTNNTLAEQPYAKTIYLPSVLTAKPSSLIHKCNALQMSGEKYKSTIENGEFEGGWLNNGTGTPTLLIPTRLMYWHVFLSNVGVSMSEYMTQGAMNVEVWHDIEFFGRNAYVSSPIA